VTYHNLLYGSPGGKQWQPAEGTAGPTNNNLVTMAQKYAKFSSADISTFTTCVNGQTHKALVQAMTEQSSKRGVTGTPTVYVNGKALSSTTWKALSAAIAAADAKGPAPSPSPTPSTSASSSPTPSGSPSKTPTATKSS